jgi:CspA family cold shock protein
MKNGIVKFFNGSKGYGFIKEEGIEKDHFVHVSGLIDRIDENEKLNLNLKKVLKE